LRAPLGFRDPACNIATVPGTHQRTTQSTTSNERETQNRRRAGLTGVSADAEALALETLGKATAVAQSLPEAAANQLLFAGRTAFTMGMQVTAGVSAVVAAASAVVVIVMLRRSPVEAERSQVSDGQSVADVRGATRRPEGFPSAAEVANAAAVTVSDLPRSVMSPDCH
jgi:hypothetical protein